MVTTVRYRGSIIAQRTKLLTDLIHISCEVGYYIPVGNSDWQSKASTTALIHLASKRA